jgi:phosphocarrier protein HPr
VKTFKYTITDAIGIHARPAGMLAKEASKYSSEITITCNEKSVSARKLMAIMGMGIKHGMEVTLTIMGADEEQAANQLEEFFRENL